MLKKRLEWFGGQLDLDPDKLVFIDETGASTNLARKGGRCRRGRRLRIGVPREYRSDDMPPEIEALWQQGLAGLREAGAETVEVSLPHTHYKTVTLVAGIRLRGLVAAKTYDRPINAALFEEWVENCLIPTLSKGDVVVMDNLPAHKGPRVEEMIKAAGAELRYLPPYSPDMNPIEKAFSKLKAHLRKIAERTVAALMRALETCADIFKPAECANYFAACGYDPP